MRYSNELHKHHIGMAVVAAPWSFVGCRPPGAEAQCRSYSSKVRALGRCSYGRTHTGLTQGFSCKFLGQYRYIWADSTQNVCQSSCKVETKALFFESNCNTEELFQKVREDTELKGESALLENIKNIEREDISLERSQNGETLIHTEESSTSSCVRLPLEDLACSEEETFPGLQQRSEEWHELRRDRLTSSSFADALGFWKGRRVALWKEKIGLKEPFAGNSATRWGTAREYNAILKYKAITGFQVESLSFKVYREDDASLSWLGGSPDGLIEGHVSGVFGKKGVLEVKCPHNKGRPQRCIPWSAVPYYYIPQAQGLMEILDRDWMDFYIWTVNGSSAFRLHRDTKYWDSIYMALKEFWWEHVIPARKAIKEGKLKSEILSLYKPKAEHLLTETLVNESKELALACPVQWTVTD